MTPDDADRPDDETRRQAVRALEDSFRALTEQLRRYYVRAAELVSPGMLPGTFKVLATIARTGPVSQSALVERLVSDKGMVSRQVSQLEELGLVGRSADASDARIRLIDLTALGRERIAAAQQPYQESLHRALADWPLESIDNLSTLVHALATGTTPGADGD